jgi:hypothetical protein
MFTGIISAMRCRGTPMTLANMRANGVRSLDVWCSGRGQHHTVINVDAYPGDVTVPNFGPRMVCKICGAIGADVRPNWNERAAIGAFMPAPR